MKKTMRTLTGHYVSVLNNDIGCWVGANPMQEPVAGAYLKPSEARKLAQWLLRVADRYESDSR